MGETRDQIWTDIQAHAVKRAMSAAEPIIRLMEPKEYAVLYAAIGLEFYIKAAAFHSAASGGPGPESQEEMAAGAANYMRAMADIIDPNKAAGAQS